MRWRIQGQHKENDPLILIEPHLLEIPRVYMSINSVALLTGLRIESGGQGLLVATQTSSHRTETSLIYFETLYTYTNIN